MNPYRIKAIHFADKLRLRDLREKLSQGVFEFTNYEMAIKYGEDSYAFIYNYGSMVFFNVPEETLEREVAAILDANPMPSLARTIDTFLFEVQPQLSPGENKVFFDRLVTSSLNYNKIRICCRLLAESTGLEHYEILIENLLERTNTFSKKLESRGRILESSEELIKFIGMCLNTKQEIISNLYIVDSPDETWESAELDKIYNDLKLMFEVDIRYRALEYKTKIIQESLEIIVDLAKSKREFMLELIIILLITFEVILSVVKWA